MAFRQIINKVLRRLREDTITGDWTGVIEDSADVDDYHTLISDFVNEAKTMVEDAWQWTYLRRVEEFSTVASTVSYALTGVNSRQRILGVWDNTNDQAVPQMSDNAFMRYKYVGDQSSSIPSAYRLIGNSIEIYPVPDAVYDLKVLLVDPQDDLTLAADTLSVPELPVVLGAYALALAERGEDGGVTSDVAYVRYTQSLSDALIQDEGRTIGETTWYAP